MDSITHVALGAITGELIAGKKIGKRAMFFGAIAQSLPDIDFVASFWLSPADNLLAHRGITHSLLFLVIATVSLSFISERTHRPQQVKWGEWLLFYAVEIGLHLVLDVCNAYGIGLLEPFSDKRFSFHILFVADIFFSVWLGAGLAALMIMDSKNPNRIRWIYFSLIMSSGYFLHAVTNKISTTRAVKEAASKLTTKPGRILTTPTPLNSWLWFVAVEDQSGFHIAHRSVWDQDDTPFDFTFVPRNDSLLVPYRETHDTQQLLKFSQGYYTVDEVGGIIVFNDLRFGQSAGWEDPTAPFVFHYFMNDPDANLLVIQRGRFSNWNRQTFESFIRRIKGR